MRWIMENISELLEQANTILNNKLKQLEYLEIEKKRIISMYEKASSTERITLENEMQKSKEKYKNLCAEVLTFAEKVKKLKAHYC